jgi:hypothetical protein
MYYAFPAIIAINTDYSLNNINQPQFVTVFVYFKVGTVF